MSEEEKEMPVDTDYFTGKQAEILKNIDKKNVDTETLKDALQSFLDTYDKVTNGE